MVFRYLKDGGPKSRVAGWFLVELKRLCSIVLLHFFPGSREAYHSHAFNAVSWLLRGRLTEHVLHLDGSTTVNVYVPSWRPILTRRDRFHMVVSDGHSWALSFRGPWAATWREFIPQRGFLTLTHGRKEVAA